MAKKLVIPFGEYQIVAEINALNLPEIPEELCVYITDKNNEFIQDVCIVRRQFEYGNIGEPYIPIGDAISCLVWSDSDNEDFTHDFGIDVYKEEE